MRKLALFTAAFSAGVFLWRYGLAPGCLILAGMCLFALIPSPHHTRKALLLLAFGLLLAWGWSLLYAHLVLSPWETRHKERNVSLVAELQDHPSLTQRGQRSAPARIRDPARDVEIDGLVYLPTEADAALGDTVFLRGTLYVADRVGEEELTYYSSQGLYLRVYASTVEKISTPERLPLRHWPMAFSHRLGDTLLHILGERRGGLAKALVTGDRSSLEDHYLAMSRRAGLAHIIVVSGMHMGILAGAIHVLFRRNSRAGAALTLLLLAFFALAAGGTPSAWRAVILCGMGLLAPLAGRENDPATSLLAALFLLLLYNPFSAASVSLQLSFAAVAGIFLITPGLTRKFCPVPPWEEAGLALRLLRRLWNGLGSSLAVTLGALLFTTPLSAVYFGIISLIGPLSNLLTLPVVSTAFLGSALAGVVGLLSPAAGRLLAIPLKLPLEYLLRLIPALGELPFAALPLHAVYLRVGGAVCYALICLFLFFPSQGKKQLLPHLCCLLLVAGASVALFRLEYTVADLSTTVLDVGQGQSVCLSMDGETVLVDCGGSGSTNAGDAAADHLASLGVDTLDLLVLTHYHEDHANGVPQLFRRMSVRKLALPDVERNDPLRQEILTLAEAAGTEILWITKNGTYPLGEGGTLTLYAPLGDGGVNERGLSVLAGANGYDVLITGDMNDAVERRLVKYGGLPDIELLVVGHHGSRSSTCEALLEHTRPETAVISVGSGNSYGHPADETLSRLTEAGASIHRTDLDGTVTIHGKGRGSSS